MATLYLFCIGGTGSRVLRSLTMLLGAGVKLGAGIDTVAPIVIDPDQSNADLTRTNTLLNTYNALQQQLKGSGVSFFETRIAQVVPRYTIPVVDTNSATFEDFMQLSSMPDEAKALLQMLFSVDNLSSSMEVGFKGNPNIGSVVLRQVMESSEFQNVASTFKLGDRFFVISSIFGGTGASGFPLLVKSLRTDNKLDNSGALNQAMIGAVSLLPYFSLKSNPDSAIDSNSFIGKTRAALGYYQHNLADLDYLYYLGDDMLNQYENCEGGEEQENDAHLMELLAALAVVDFTKTTAAPEGDVRPTIYKEMGIERAGKAVGWDDFFAPTKVIVQQPLVKMTLMANGFTHQRSFLTSPNRAFNKGQDAYSSDFATKLFYFCDDYRQWLGELASNNRGLQLFNLDCGDKPFHLLGQERVKKVLAFASDYDLFVRYLDEAKASATDAHVQLLQRYDAATNTMIAKKLKL